MKSSNVKTGSKEQILYEEMGKVINCFRHT